MCLKRRHAKFQGNIFKLGVEWMGIGKMCIFQCKTGHISETVRDTAEVSINH